MKNLRLNSATTMSALLLSATGALAATDNDRVGFTLEEVTVTARKVEESLQDTPISIAAFTSNDLENRQIDSSDKLTQVTPNLTFSTQAPASGHNASSQIFIRGIGQTDYLALTDPGVGFYVDGVYNARTLGATIDFLDIERIEVLRGPQGTLFGRNTIGGAISIITRKPDEEFGGNIKVTAGSDSRQDVVANLNIPVADTLLMGLALADRNQDGYVTRLQDNNKDVGDNNATSFRGRTLWTPSDSFEADIIVEYTKEDENGSPMVMNSISSNQTFARIASAQAGCPAPGTEIIDPRCANNQWVAGPYANNGTFPIHSKLEVYGASATLTWNLDQVSIKSITAFRELDASAARDADNTPQRVLHTTLVSEDRQFSQELQFTGEAFDSRMNWVLGLYYFDQYGKDTNDVFLPVGDISLGGPADIESKAAFGQFTYDITEELSLTLGLRYSEEEKVYSPENFALTNYAYPAPLGQGPAGFTQLPNGLVLVPAGVSLVPPEDATTSVSDTTPLLNLAYQVNDEVMIYFNYAEGFKGGGFSTRVIEVVDEAMAFKPEYATSYEAGFKSDLFDSKLRLNGAIFYTDYSDMQFVVRPQLAPLTFNAGESEIQGGELELTLVPTSSLLITAGVGYTDGKYTQLDQVVLDVGINKDSEFQQTPSTSANLGAAYSIDLQNSSIITATLDWSYRSTVQFDAVNTKALEQEGYSVVNASVSWESPEQDWKVMLGLTNLTDEEYRVAGFSSLAGSGSYAESTYARPREWSLSAKYQF